MGLSTRDLGRIAECLARQGCTVRPTKKGGWFIYPPKGGRMFTFHGSPSDGNQEKVLRKDVELAGLIWPLSPEGRKL